MHTELLSQGRVSTRIMVVTAHPGNEECSWAAQHGHNGKPLETFKWGMENS